MPVDVKDKGRYELFDSTHGHRILVLDGKRFYAWVHGRRGEIIVHTDSDHQKDHTLQRGKFFLVDFRNDPKFKDMIHLFLQKGDRFEEIMLPNGLPTESDAQKKIVRTKDSIATEDLERYLKHPAKAGPGESRLRGHMKRPTGGSMSNVAHYLKGIDLPASGSEIVRYAKQRHAPKSALNELEDLGKSTRYHSMADVMKAIGGEHEARGHGGAERELPIPSYNELTARQASKRILSLDSKELKKVRNYESRHKHRKTVLEAIDRAEG